MNIKEFDYQLPEKRIAQTPLKERDASRLLVVRRKGGIIEDAGFKDLIEYLSPSDILVVNNCKVMPGRLRARRKTGAELELTLLDRGGESNGNWQALVKGRQPKTGETVKASGNMEVEFVEPLPFDISEETSAKGGRWSILLRSDEKVVSPKDLEDLLERNGLAPLPPYIRRNGEKDKSLDRERYQTVYAKHWSEGSQGGAAAAPTAGLHFTERMLQRIKEKGVKLVELTLWVSYGTFAPVRVKDITRHRMFSERYSLDRETARAINETRERGGRVVAVGTTVVRTLEHNADERGRVRAGEGETSLFIYPGYRFRAVDALLTNFHMPRSTLLMLIMAFGGKELTGKAYTRALDLGYRFLSYGDAMLIV